MKKVLVFFACGTEEIEALTPVDLLRRAGADVTLVGVEVNDKLNVGSHGIRVVADCTADELDPNMDFDMLVLPGGMPGTTNLDVSPVVDHFISRAVKENKLIGAICAAPTILGRRGLLDGKNATCYPGMEDGLVGANVKKARDGYTVVTDGNIITAAGAGVAVDFALTLIYALYGAEVHDKIEYSIVAG
ncbi:MAG: DJ-1/PfpI family protein [Clostridia bacterium]|nr:DJ-1/PfpI family protein [Clostridia bacterium]